MKTAFFNHPRVRQILTLVFLPGAVACIFPPSGPAFEWWAQHSVGVALGYVILAILFLFFNNSRLMFVCLGCGAVISFNSQEKMLRSFHQHDPQRHCKQWQIPYVVPIPGDLSNYVLPANAAPPQN